MAEDDDLVNPEDRSRTALLAEDGDLDNRGDQPRTTLMSDDRSRPALVAEDGDHDNRDDRSRPVTTTGNFNFALNMDRHRKPNRLYNYDYSSDGLYFVTPYVHGMICCLGEIINEEMQLNAYGKIAEQQWLWLGKQYPYVFLHSFVIMPNHMHGIIEIDKHYKAEITQQTVVGTGRDLSSYTNRDLSLDIQSTPIKIKSISELMGAYKTTTSKQIHQIGFEEFKWQRSFHDHIIRDAKAFETITNYIENNPRSWPEDKFYKK